ncbi:SPOR domain-containing protein [Wohlfahrtiimonas larvae]|uniref:SPOR domain-containing protein n=1 Tax=Wohlfahrtiimonas larvae TaxID=1157986 RepID=A0ABP9MSG6_9GAMM|nr:SPOR domain-containing protein [Wohlfahrtiimonas larvae]
MAKKYSQAKRQRNPFAKKHPNSKKNRITTSVVVILFLGLCVSAVASYFSNKGKETPVPKINKAANIKDAHPKRVVKPLSDEDFKGAKEYNFYTQLEERSLILGEEDRFGGIPLDNIHEPPKINLESASQSVATTKKAQNNDFVIAPLILESSQQKNTEPSTSMIKPVAKSEGNISLQVGSFTARKEAEKHQAFLAKYGFTAKIQQGKNQAQQDIYRVRIGGFSQKEVSAVKKRLGTLGVSYFEVK